MLIEIKSRFTGDVIVSGGYQSVGECLEKNRDADLEDADLRGADLRGADLEDAYLGGADLGGANLRDANLGGAYLGGANLRGADLGAAYLGGAYLGGAYLGGAYLGGADLRGAYLRGADLIGADLGGADLRGADLIDIKNYSQNHSIFAELIHRQKAGIFTEAEWSAIAQIMIYTLCWSSIRKRFANAIPHVFEILAQAGWREYLDHWNKLVKEE